MSAIKLSRMAEQIKPGDVIMPPQREVQLWMRRHVAERNLGESALHLTVTAVREGAPDKGGRWLVVTSDQSPEWRAGPLHPFTFKVRPGTPWVFVKGAA